MSVVSVIIRAVHDSTQALSSIQRQTDAYYRLSTGTNQAVMRFEALHGSSRKLFGLWNSLSALSAAPGRLAGLVSEKMTAAVSTFADMQRALFETKYQGGATEQELSQLRTTAEELAPQIGRSSTEIINLGRMLRAAGLAGKDMQDVLAGSIKLGTMFGRLDMKTLADIGIVSWQRFGKEVGDAGKLMETMLNFTGISRIDPENLVAWLNSLGSLNITARGQLPTIMALSSIMSRSGASAAESAHKVNILVNSLVNLDRMSAQALTTGNRYVGRLKMAAKAALDSDVFDAGKFRNLLDVLDDIDAAMAGMSEEDVAFQSMNAVRQQAKDVILAYRNFGIQKSDLADLTGDHSTEMLKGGRAAEYLAYAVGRASGRLEEGSEAARELTGTVQGGLTAAIDSLNVAIGEKAAPLVDAWNKALTGVVSTLTNLIRQSGWAGEAIAGIGLASATAGKWTASLLADLTGVVFNLAGFSVFMRQLGAGRTGLGGAKLAAGGALWGATKFAGRSILGTIGAAFGTKAAMGLAGAAGLGALGLGAVAAYELYKSWNKTPERRQYSSSTGPAVESPPAAPGAQKPMRLDLNVQANIDKQNLMNVVRRDLETKKLRDWNTFSSDVLDR